MDEGVVWGFRIASGMLALAALALGVAWIGTGEAQFLPPAVTAGALAVVSGWIAARGER